jgi:hypothetical protein
MIFLVVDREEGALAWFIVVAMVVLGSTARVFWHPCTMDSGKHDFRSLSKALFSGHNFFVAELSVPGHSK